MTEPIDYGDDAETTAHPCPSCGALAPGHLYACRTCTARLPLKLRRRANRAWRQDDDDTVLQAAKQYLAHTTPTTTETSAVSAYLDRITR